MRKQQVQVRTPGEKTEVVSRLFMPAEFLKLKYGVFGHFYSVELPSQEVIECRSVLEIISRSHVQSDLGGLFAEQPDAVFIMMNPGSSKPLDDVSNHIQAERIGNLSISLVPTKPDTTQYQVMRVMHNRGWRHVRVLNLSDLRSPKSPELIRTFRRLEKQYSFEAHSIFSDARKTELTQKLPRNRSVPLVLAWGVSDKLTPLVERCMAKLPSNRTVFGVLEPGSNNKYRHPLPSLQKDKLRWLEQIVQQLEE